MLDSQATSSGPEATAPASTPSKQRAKGIPIIEMDTNINDPAFRKVAETLLAMLK